MTCSATTTEQAWYFMWKLCFRPRSAILSALHDVQNVPIGLGIWGSGHWGQHTHLVLKGEAPGKGDRAEGYLDWLGLGLCMTV